MNYLPSKKIFISLILVIILVGGVFFISERGKRGGNSISLGENENNFTESLVSSRTIKQSAEKDSDGDGLPDWEEALWETDPLNPDSDGNGVSDKEEIQLLKEQELAALSSVVAGETLSGEGDVENLNRTGSFAVDLFSRYFDAKDGGAGALSPSESQNIQDTLINSFVLDLESSGRGLPEFLSDDIDIIETSRASIKEYGNNLGRIFLKYENKRGHGSPVEILVNALDGRDESKADDLKILAEDYFKGAEEIIEIPTPGGVLSLHLSLVNNLISTGENVSSLGDVFVDPLASLGALSFYIDNSTLLLDSLNEIREYIKSEGISYSPQESGYIIMNGI